MRCDNKDDWTTKTALPHSSAVAELTFMEVSLKYSKKYTKEIHQFMIIFISSYFGTLKTGLLAFSTVVLFVAIACNKLPFHISLVQTQIEK